MELFKKGSQETRHANVERVVQGNSQFALDLYQRLRTRSGNLFFSPYSISTALAMTCAGARGSTESQVAKVLHFLLEQDQLHQAFAWLEANLRDVEKQGHVQLRVANSLWPHSDSLCWTSSLP